MPSSSKVRPLRDKATHLDKNRLPKDQAKGCLDRAGVSGALFPRKSAKFVVVTARQGLGAAKQHTMQRKALKALHQGVDGSVFGPRSVFLVKFGEAGPGGRKAGLGRGKTKHFHEKNSQMDGEWTGGRRVWTAQA